jgi:regulator of nonsense transcripts 2
MQNPIFNLTFYNLVKSKIDRKSFKIEFPTKLDGSIKKNSAFLKKLKQGIQAQHLESLKKELLSLKVDHYKEEIAVSIAEKSYKTNSDTLAVIEICLILNQRFDDFMDLFITELKNQFKIAFKEENEKIRITKLKSCIRLFTELYFQGFIKDKVKSKDTGFFIATLLDQVLTKDITFDNISIAVSFCKHYIGFFYPFEGDDQISKNCITERNNLIPFECVQKVYQILANYYDKASKSLVKDHQKLTLTEKSNQDSMIARGTLLKEKQEYYEKLLLNFEKFKQNVLLLSECLLLDFPELKVEQDSNIFLIGISEVKQQLDGIWDADEMNFYDNVIDLANLVPPILLGKKVEQTMELIDVDYSDEALNAEVPEKDVVVVHDENIADCGNNLKLELLLEKLSTLLNKEAIDQIAVEFAFLNNKGARNKLSQVLLGVSRSRLDLLPLYARLIATLNPYMPDLGEQIVAELHNTFRYHQRKKEQQFIEEKIKNIRFISELTKFKICPLHVVFNCLKVLLEHFNFHNVEIACNLLESCGRYLVLNPTSSPVMTNFVFLI